MRVVGWKTRRRNESEFCANKKRCKSSDLWGMQHQPTMNQGEWFEWEHTCWHPIDGDLYLCRAKPEETLVEARSGTDVQIVRRTWV